MMTPYEINMLIDDYIGTDSGYLKHFSYSKHDEFYYRYCNLSIDVAAYRSQGMTTLRAFTHILKDSEPRVQAKIIRGVFLMIPPPGESEDEQDRKKIELHKNLLIVAARLESDGQVDTPDIQVTSEIVFEALKDSEALLRARSPKNAVDRAHTALHGYLLKLCNDRSYPLPADASMTAVFKVIREKFPGFSSIIPHDAEAKRVFGAMASVLDSLNTIRNRGTLAHPNELLLEDPEAMLYINLSRAILGYVEAKINA